MMNRQFRLASRPVGMPKASDWNDVREPVREPAENEVLVRVEYLSLDPAMRGWMNDVRSYVPPVGIGEVMRASGAGRVVSSRDPRFAPGDAVAAIVGVQEYATLPGASLTRLDPDLAPLPVYLSALGFSGMTAYFGLLDVGRPQPGDVVVVSGAAGSVGMLVGQIAKIAGCRAIGIAGGPEKCAFLRDELGFDGTIDYKSEDVSKALRRECPAGIDVYFDNVGGSTLDDCLAKLRLHARVVICGAISQYNNTTAVQGPSNYMSLLVNRASMTGMVVFDYTERFPEAVRELGTWLRSGRLKTREHIVRGLQHFPETLLRLFSGDHMGKLLLEVAPDPAASYRSMCVEKRTESSTSST